MKSEKLGRTKRLAIAKLVKVERVKQNYSNESLAKKAGYNERTVRNILAGKSTRFKTLVDICQVLGISVEAETRKKRTKITITDKDHGAYTREHFSEYLGFYYSYRRSFTFTNSIIRSLFEFTWSDSCNCMQFSETHRYKSPELGEMVNYNQSGDVFYSNTIGLLHLLTRFEGAVRLITLSKLELHDPTMNGIVLTQATKPMHFRPAVSPIRFQKIVSAGGGETELAKLVGPIKSDDSGYEALDASLKNIEQSYGIFAITSSNAKPT